MQVLLDFEELFPESDGDGFRAVRGAELLEEGEDVRLDARGRKRHAAVRRAMRVAIRRGGAGVRLPQAPGGRAPRQPPG